MPKHGEWFSGDCPGELILTKQIGGRRGVLDVFRCPLCNWTNDPGARRAPQEPTETEPDKIINTETGDRRMKLKLSLNRKIQAPPFGSDGAGAEIEVEVDDELAQKPDHLVSTAMHWYSILERSVGQQLDRLQAARAAAAPPPPVTDREHPDYEPPARNGSANGRRWDPDSLPQANGYAGREDRFPVRQYPEDREPERRNGSGGRGAPRNGRELIGWANSQGEDCYQALKRLVNSWKIRQRIVDLNQDDVDALYRELTVKPPSRN